jgi:hypothetical protein
LLSNLITKSVPNLRRREEDFAEAKASGVSFEAKQMAEATPLNDGLIAEAAPGHFDSERSDLKDESFWECVNEFGDDDSDSGYSGLQNDSSAGDDQMVVVGSLNMCGFAASGVMRSQGSRSLVLDDFQSPG